MAISYIRQNQKKISKMCQILTKTVNKQQNKFLIGRIHVLLKGSNYKMFLGVYPSNREIVAYEEKGTLYFGLDLRNVYLMQMNDAHLKRQVNDYINAITKHPTTCEVENNLEQILYKEFQSKYNVDIYKYQDTTSNALNFIDTDFYRTYLLPEVDKVLTSETDLKLDDEQFPSLSNRYFLPCLVFDMTNRTLPGKGYYFRNKCDVYKWTTGHMDIKFYSDDVLKKCKFAVTYNWDGVFLTNMVSLYLGYNHGTCSLTPI